MINYSRQLFRIATMGDVDSGKSTLIGQLITKWNPSFTKPQKWSDLPDGLQMERQLGITWSVGNFYCNTKDYRLHLIDDPGHLNRFDVTASGILNSDLVCYVLNPSLFNQKLFIFHLKVLLWLDLKNIIFVINYKNALTDKENANISAIEQLLDSYGVIQKNIVLANCMSGENIFITTKHKENPSFEEVLFQCLPLKKIVSRNKNSALLWEQPNGKILFYSTEMPDAPEFELSNLSSCFSHINPLDDKIAFYSDLKPASFKTISTNPYLLVSQSKKKPIGLFK